MRIHVHLGLPKTGTTYLQECCFPFMSSPGLYLGKHVGAAVEHPLYAAVRDAVQAPDFRESAERRRVEREISTLTNTGVSSVLYSNEMTLVDSGTITWQEKIGRLGAMLNDHDVELILGVRHPVPGLSSLFAELSPTLPRHYRDPDRFVRRYNGARIFRYRDLISEIEAAFRVERFSFVDFSDIGHLSERSDLMRRLGVSRVERRTVNEKQRTSDGDYISNPSTVRSLVSRTAANRDVIQRIVPRSVWTWAATTADRLQVDKGRPVPSFDSDLSAWITQTHKDDLEYLAQRGGPKLATDS